MSELGATFNYNHLKSLETYRIELDQCPRNCNPQPLCTTFDMPLHLQVYPHITIFRIYVTHVREMCEYCPGYGTWQLCVIGI